MSNPNHSFVSFMILLFIWIQNTKCSLLMKNFRFYSMFIELDFYLIEKASFFLIVSQ